MVPSKEPHQVGAHAMYRYIGICCYHSYGMPCVAPACHPAQASHAPQASHGNPQAGRNIRLPKGKEGGRAVQVCGEVDHGVLCCSSVFLCPC